MRECFCKAILACTVWFVFCPDVLGASDSASCGPGMVILKGRFLARKARTQEALQAYLRAISDYPDRQKMVLMARRGILEVLLSDDSADLAACHGHLDSLGRCPDVTKAELWNWSFRLLLKRVLSAGRGQQEGIWKQGLSELAGGELSIAVSSVRHLDRLARSLGEKGTFAAEVVFCVQDSPRLTSCTHG